MEKLVKIFVYGTLKREEKNHHVLSNKESGFAEFQCKGKTAGKFPLVIGTRFNIPFLINRPGLGHQICGEIYAVDEKMLTTLDAFEGYPDWYGREVHDILIENEKLQCWIYMLKTFPEKLLALPCLSEYKNSPETPFNPSNEDIRTLDDLYD